MDVVADRCARWRVARDGPHDAMSFYVPSADDSYGAPVSVGRSCFVLILISLFDRRGRLQEWQQGHHPCPPPRGTRDAQAARTAAR